MRRRSLEAIKEARSPRQARGAGADWAATALLISCLLLGAACSTSGASSPRFGEAPLDPNEIAGEAALEEELLDLVNEERRAEGLAELEMDPALVAIARLHSRDMMEAGFVGHVSPTTGKLEDRLERAGYLARAARENVALNQSVVSAHESLMSSRGHRRNILAGDVTVAGMGMVGEGADLFVTQLFAEPAKLGEPGILRPALIDRINDARAEQGLPPLGVHEGLQSVAEEEVARMEIPLGQAALQRATQAALGPARRDRAFSRVATVAESILDEEDLRAPPPALTEEAVVLAVAMRTAEGPSGRPEIIVLVMIGHR